MKILHRFCSPEVRLLLTRLDEHPEEYLRSDRWDQHVLEHGEYFRYFKLIERFCISHKRRQLILAEKKQAAYGSIYTALMVDGSTQTITSKYSIFNQSQAGQVQLQPGQIYPITQSELERLKLQADLEMARLMNQATITKNP